MKIIPDVRESDNCAMTFETHFTLLSYYYRQFACLAGPMLLVCHTELTYPWEGGARNSNVGARAELLAGLEGRAGLAGRGHVGARVLVDVTEGRVERDEREEDVPEGRVLHESHLFRQRVGLCCEAHLDLK